MESIVGKIGQGSERTRKRKKGCKTVAGGLGAENELDSQEICSLVQLFFC
jgi:hypothetical protein